MPLIGIEEHWTTPGLKAALEALPDGHFAAETVPTMRGARTMALDEKTHRVFLATAEFGPPPSPTPEQPRPRPSMVPGSFTLLVVAPAP